MARSLGSQASRAASSERWRKTHPDAARASRRRAAAKFRKNNPVRAAFFDRAKNLRTKYGLTPAEWDAILALQGGKCGMCFRAVTQWATDHSHTTGRFRAILCVRCNTALAVIEHPELITLGRIYLEKHK